MRLKRKTYSIKSIGIGAGIGSTLGAGIGALKGGIRGAKIGAGIGAIGGGFLGHKATEDHIGYSATKTVPKSCDIKIVDFIKDLPKQVKEILDACGKANKLVKRCEIDNLDVPFPQLINALDQEELDRKFGEGSTSLTLCWIDTCGQQSLDYDTVSRSIVQGSYVIKDPKDFMLKYWTGLLNDWLLESNGWLSDQDKKDVKERVEVLTRIVNGTVKTKTFSDDLDFDELYDRFKKKDKPEARKRELKAAGKGLGIGAVSGSVLGAGIGKLGKHKVGKSTLIGAGIGSGIGAISGDIAQRKKQNKTYNYNKRELGGILAGFKTKDEQQRFLRTLEDELK